MANIKGLQTHLQPEEHPILTIPAIWDSGQEQRSKPCDIILTNQRLIGYVFVTFPRERLFLEALTLSDITTVTLRQQTFEPIFRELFVSDSQRKVYIRAPRQKIESLYALLRTTIGKHENSETPEPPDAENVSPRPAPIYGKQDIRTSFEHSPVGITLLFVGGLLLEICGALLWAATHNSQIGLPLCIAGIIAVITATLTRRRHRI